MDRHQADLVSLAFGLLFAAIGLATVLGGIETLSLTWIAPLLIIALGAIIILAARPSPTPAEEN